MRSGRAAFRGMNRIRSCRSSSHISVQPKNKRFPRHRTRLKIGIILGRLTHSCVDVTTFCVDVVVRKPVPALRRCYEQQCDKRGYLRDRRRIRWIECRCRCVPDGRGCGVARTRENGWRLLELWLCAVEGATRRGSQSRRASHVGGIWDRGS